MSKEEVEPTDPMEFVGMGVPATAQADEDMVRAVVEEFLLLGFDRDRILRLFRDPFYAGTHRVLAERGEPFVTALVDGVLDEWGPTAEGDN